MLLELLLGSILAMANVSDEESGEIFATVNGEVITVEAYAQALRHGARTRFYHGRAPEAQVLAFQRKVADELIDARLIAQEARRLGLVAEPGQKTTETGGAVASHQVEVKKLVDALKRQLPEPELNETQVADYYARNLQQFTRPARQRVSVILRSVDPASPPPAWAAAEEELAEARVAIARGRAFEALAREISDDESAAEGGDMGYVHDGVLGGPARTAVAALQPGEMSQPVRILEGVALFRLADRQPPRLMPLAEVRDRAAALAMREARGLAWQQMLAGLRARGSIDIAQRYLTLQGGQ